MGGVGRRVPGRRSSRRAGLLPESLEWLDDEAVQAQLDDNERKWHIRATELPLVTMFEGVAKAVGCRWLTRIKGAEAMPDYYGFLKTYLVRVV
jgi:hypothetical protein